MILLTGAAGKTGKAILNTLLPHGVRVRSLVRSQTQAEEIRTIGGKHIAIGDLRDHDAMASAMEGVNSIYFIAPNMAPDELEIGKDIIKIARQKGINRFVYHSVLHPQVEAMPHHWQKMRMEEYLFESGMEYTILQPCAYMQNMLGSFNSIIKDGVYSVPYATSARISIVDLQDIASTAEIVLTGRNHNGAIYELAGPEPLSQDEVAAILATELDRPVNAIAIDRVLWAENARTSGVNNTAIATLVKMFEYYEKHGLVGNSNILTYLLNRPATRFAEFVQRHFPTDPRKNR
jgi:NAD(P)H dehydrogenase (quinone)